MLCETASIYRDMRVYCTPTYSKTYNTQRHTLYPSIMKCVRYFNFIKHNILWIEQQSLRHSRTLTHLLKMPMLHIQYIFIYTWIEWYCDTGTYTPMNMYIIIFYFYRCDKRENAFCSPCGLTLYIYGHMLCDVIFLKSLNLFTIRVAFVHFKYTYI